MKAKRDRVLICFDNSFPRAGASSNYVEYLGLALLNAGYEVIVVGMDERGKGDAGIFKAYKGIRYVLLGKNHWRKNLYSYLLNFDFKPDDFVIVYTFKLRTIEPVLKLSKRREVKMAVCVVEWFRRVQLGKSLRGYVRYFFYWIFFYIVLPRAGNIIPISRHLEEHFKNVKCHTLLMPILMSNASDSERKPHDQPLNFIYSGYSWEKDCLDKVFKAIFRLPERDRNIIHYHICGMKESEFRQCLGNDDDLVERALAITTLYPWMEFEEYEKLLDTMDFVIIARKVNRTSLSNFPSKVPEMMAHGIIPVASRVGDYTDLYLEDGVDSLIFDGCETEACERAILRALHLSHSAREQLSQNAKKTVDEKFYYGLWSDKLRNFIEDSKKSTR